MDTIVASERMLHSTPVKSKVNCNSVKVSNSQAVPTCFMQLQTVSIVVCLKNYNCYLYFWYQNEKVGATFCTLDNNFHQKKLSAETS